VISTSRESDPQAIVDAFAAAIDAFNEEGYSVPTHENAINSDADWKTQLTKACRLLAAVDTLSDQGFYTATIELCFGVTERSVEAYALAEGGDDLEDFHDHTTCYDRATDLGLLSDTTTRDLRQLYDTNRTDSYTAADARQHGKQTQCSNSLAASTSTSPTRSGKAACASVTRTERHLSVLDISHAVSLANPGADTYN
jgi:hypothetical protein